MDYSGLLERIASAAEGVANTPNYWWIAPIAVLVSAGIGYWASQRSIKQQTKIAETNQAKKKDFVFKLLQHEIDFRWTIDIKPHVEKVATLEKLTCLKRFSTMKFRDDDVFVFRQISLAFQEYYFFENVTLVSNIVHGYLLYKDLMDFNVTVNRFLNEYDQRKEALTATLNDREVKSKLNEEFCKSIDELATSLPEKIKVIDSRFQSIIPDITSQQDKD